MAENKAGLLTKMTLFLEKYLMPIAGKIADEKTLLVLPAYNNNVYLSSRNLKKAKVIVASDLNTYDVLNATKLLLTADSVKTLEEALAK